ncbi:MAG: hypothetical protein FRX48_07587 [Lasallia pustulata]|uniref:BZIP domain-containing protein n=1 Tax=Lasallia pustulata TaxID=136370 RepID=A0A5M8PGQ8_9LECA|nr:MAG: hypothetical protein FRX48_07587 [Lasallia pustulata]
MTAATHTYVPPSDVLQNTPGFFTAAIAAADENENPFENSFKAGNAVLEQGKELPQLYEEGAHRGSNTFLRALNAGDFSPLFGFSPRTSPGPYANAQFLSSGSYNPLYASDLAPPSAWPGPKLDRYPPPPTIYRQEPSPPNSAHSSPENWLFDEYPLQQPVHSPLHAILTKDLPQETHAQYNQATPPDDLAPVGFEHQFPLPQTQRSTESQPATIGKRKRTLQSNNEVVPAAPAKRVRKSAKSASPDQSSMSDNNKPEDAKRSKFLERNRVAASKCRQKKKEWTSNLESRARELQNSKSQLNIMVGSLKEEVLFLKTELLRHTGCGCTKIRDYLSHEAHALARPSSSGVIENAASPVGLVSSSRVGSVSAASTHEDSKTASIGGDTASTPPAGEHAMDEVEGLPSPTVKFETKEFEALLTSRLVEDANDEGDSACAELLAQ